MNKKENEKLEINRKMFDSLEDFCMRGRGCATNHPTHYQIGRNDERLAASRVSLELIGPIIIDVQFIHITSGNTGKITETRRCKQIEVLNDAYSSYGIVFGFDEGQVKHINNEEWYQMDHGSRAEKDAKSALRGSPERHLNFYTAGIGAGLLGWATFPWELEGNRDLDGVVMLHSTLPGGNTDRFNLGKTAVHEVGHWLGLYHTFQGGCGAFGDHVGDTEGHASPDTGTPKTALSCDGRQNAPVHNFMNYTDDIHMEEFTKGQINRIKRHVSEYRPAFIKI